MLTPKCSIVTFDDGFYLNLLQGVSRIISLNAHKIMSLFFFFLTHVYSGIQARDYESVQEASLSTVKKLTLDTSIETIAIGDMPVDLQ